MAVRIRLKKLGRRHRPFFRVCAVDARAARDGRVIEELGYYDPMIRDTDARAVLDRDRIDYWLGVGAQPSEKVGVLIRKYGNNGSHLDKQQSALERLKVSAPTAPPPVKIELPSEEPEPAPAEETAAETPAAEAAAAEAAADAPAEGGEPAASEEPKEQSE